MLQQAYNRHVSFKSQRIVLFRGLYRTGRIAVIISLLLLTECTDAHHSNPVTPVGQQLTVFPSDNISTVDDGVGFSGLHLETMIGYQFAYFSRWLQGSTTEKGSGRGYALQQTLPISMRIYSKNRTAFGVQIPIGLMTISPADGNIRHAIGPGDLQLYGEQDLLSLWGDHLKSHRTLHSHMRLYLQVGLRLPTGHYDPELRLSLTDISADETTPGQIRSATYNTQANLGAGSWAVMTSLRFSGQLAARLHLLADLMMVKSLNRTPDDFSWGTDIVSTLRLRSPMSRRLASQGLSLIGGIDGQRHSNRFS